MIIKGFRRRLSLAFTSPRWLSRLMGIVCLWYGPSQEAGLEVAAPELGPLQPIASNAWKGKGFPSSKIMLGNLCGPAHTKELGRVGAACSMHGGQAAALQEPQLQQSPAPVCRWDVTSPLTHAVPGEWPSKSCTPAAALAAMVRRASCIWPWTFSSSLPQRPRALGHAGGFCSEREGCCHHPLLLPPPHKMSLCPGAPAL